MKSKEIFGLLLRLIGLVFVYQALSAVPSAIFNFCPVFPHFNFKTLLPSSVLIGWPLIVGLYLVKGAPRLMRLAYPENSSSESPPSKADSHPPHA